MTDRVLENTVVRGTVRALTDGFAVIEVEAGVAGRVPLAEFGKPPAVSEGDPVEVLVELLTEGKDAVLTAVLSKEKADQLRKWDVVAKAHAAGELVEGTVVARITGGFSVDIGLRAFLPVKHADVNPVKNPDGLLGQKLQFRILKLEEEDARVVLSRRLLVAAEREAQKSETLSRLKEGVILEGTVKSLTDYGAFVDLGGIEGLLHITEMSWSRIGHPRELLTVGDALEVMVLKYDPATGRVGLGLKQTRPEGEAQAKARRPGLRPLAPNPWSQVEELYPIGSVIRGKVRSVTDFGVFVGVQEGVDGLVHVSELSWTQRIKHPGELYKKGDTVEAMVLDIDVPNERFSLGIRQLKPDPWTELLTTHPIGSVCKGKVTRVVDFGCFVEIEPGIEGLVHVSQLRDERIENPRDVVKPGDEVTVRVIDIESDARKVALSMKAAQDEEFDYRETMRNLEKEGRASFADVLAGKLPRPKDGE